MLLFSIPLVMAVFLVIIALHVLALIFKETPSRILNFVNIFLHILIIPLLIYYNFTFEESVLLYMISITVYTGGAFIKFKREEKKSGIAVCNIAQDVEIDSLEEDAL